VCFADGTQSEADAIIWATGYRPDYSWLKLPVVDADGRIRHRRGVTDQAGLYFLGLTWQHTRGSALLGWVKDDADFIAGQLATHADTRTLTPTRQRRPGPADTTLSSSFPGG
jgi:putative flavoprotein involved in K+ transport